MRKPPQLLVCILIVIGCAAHSQQAQSVSEILQTNQYIFVTQQDEFTFVQTDISAEDCPQLITNSYSNSPKWMNFVGLHLVRDPDGLLPPRIMTVKEDNNFINFLLLDINATIIFENNQRKHVMLYNDQEKGSFLKDPSFYKYGKKLAGTMFDYTNQMIYVDYSTPSVLEIEQYLILNPFRDDYRTVRIQTIKKPLNGTRFNFTEDPYSDSFYYKDNLENGEFLYQAPLSRFWQIVLKKENGTLKKRFLGNEKLNGASGGMFFTIGKPLHRKNSTIRASLTSSNENAEIVCNFNKGGQTLPKFNRAIIIRNNDYCMIRDGPDFDKYKCLEEHTNYMIENGLIDVNEDTSALKWLLIVCILFFVIIVMLCVYIFWLRSTFAVEDDRSRQHEFQYDTEASLFVAKQRSFPSAYQDPALLDVSVDRWN